MIHNGSASAINDSPGKVVDIVCDCHFLWSLAHNFCYERLHAHSPALQGDEHLIDRFVDRARRIAATYARFYLEEEDGGDSSKKGRYYWMALGAFASKTVACLLDTGAVRTMARVPELHRSPLKNYPIVSASLGANIARTQTVPLGLGKGNLWLFIDIAASHWLYNNYPDDFKSGMECEDKRRVSELVPAIKDFTGNIRWADESLKELEDFKPSNYIIKGFNLIKDFEMTTAVKKRQRLQLDSLMAIADHEQRVVLQKLVYNDWFFTKYAQVERVLTYPIKEIKKTRQNI